MKNMMKKIYGLAMTLYGASLTTLAFIYGIVMDDMYVDERVGVVLLVTCLPALIHGLRILKEVWVEAAIQRKDKEIAEIKKTCQLTIVDKASA